MYNETQHGREDKDRKFELSLLDPTVIWNGSTANEVINASIKLAEEADQLGYNRYWFTENHNTEFHASSTPEILAAQILATTSRIKVGTANLMLPHQSPLKVAENFRTVEGVYPRRIDLGISLTTGPDNLTARALHRTHQPLNKNEFQQQVTELLAFFTDTYATNYGEIIAAPQVATTPDIWIEGIDHDSARYASEFGIGFIYEYEGSQSVAREMLTSYRKFFQPSPFLTEARAILIVSVLCAQSDEEAEKIAFSQTDSDPLQITEDKRVIGSPKTVGSHLRKLAEETTANEQMIVTSHPDFDVRKKSLELLATEFNLTKNLQKRSE